MISLGIDPGYQRIGFGIIEKKHGGEIKLIKAGLLKVRARNIPEIAIEVKAGIQELISTFHPKIAALEKLYFAKNQKTALRVAEMRGIIMLALKEEGMSPLEFSPSEIKAGITGYGASDKKSVAKMVKLVLKEPTLRIIDDASDALAIAILASQQKLPATLC